MNKVEHRGNNVIWTFPTGNVYVIPYTKHIKILDSWKSGTDYETHIIKSLKKKGGNKRP